MRPRCPPTDPGSLRLPRGEHWDLQASGPPVLDAGAEFTPPGQHPESGTRSLQRGPRGLESRVKGQGRGEEGRSPWVPRRGAGRLAPRGQRRLLGPQHRKPGGWSFGIRHSDHLARVLTYADD